MREQSFQEAWPGHSYCQNLQAFIGLGHGPPIDNYETRRPSCRSLDQPGQRPARMAGRFLGHRVALRFAVRQAGAGFGSES
jgi:hypothetical protein